MNELLSWGLPITAVIALITFGIMVLQFGELSTDDFWIARGFFRLAAIIGLGRITLWALTTSRPPTTRVLIGIIAWGLISPIAIEAVRYVNRRHARWIQRQVTQKEVASRASLIPIAPPEAKELQRERPITVESDGRIILDVTPEYLTGIFNDHTAAQATKLVETYIGKWLRVSGTVLDVVSYQQNVVPSVVVQVANSLGSFISADFTEQRWIDHVTTLQRRAEIRVLGKLSMVNSQFITLNECELTN